MQAFSAGLLQLSFINSWFFQTIHFIDYNLLQIDNQTGELFNILALINHPAFSMIQVQT